MRFACFLSSGRTAAYGEKQEQRRNRCIQRRKDIHIINIRTMKELLKLWKADCEAEGFSKKDYIIVAKAVVLFSIFLAIL